MRQMIQGVTMLVLAWLLLVALVLALPPLFRVNVNETGYGGLIAYGAGGAGQCILADLDGVTVAFSLAVASPQCYDFKRHASGDFVFASRNEVPNWRRYTPAGVLTATYGISGSNDDPHDIIIDDGAGVVWLMGRRAHTADLTAYGGAVTDTIRASTIQAQSVPTGEILFDWDSWDYISLDEATVAIEDGVSIPHSNSFWTDPDDGNMIVSFRNIDSVMKLCTTGDGCELGEIVWRAGGTLSDFAITDGDVFYKQHSAQILHRCHAATPRCLLLFDNGNDRGYSRAVEYALDEPGRRLTRTWEYSAGGSIYAQATGNVQRLVNGDTAISWGNARRFDAAAPSVSIVDRGGALVYEMMLPGEIVTYRAWVYPGWQVWLP